MRPWAVVAELITTPPLHTTTALAYRTVLSRINSYLAGAWWTAKGYPVSDLPVLAQDEYGIRGAGMAALGLAAGWVTREQDTAVTEQAATRAQQLSSAAAAQHKATKGASGWGGGWQDGYWAALNGLASLLLWPVYLTTTALREPVAKMIEWEANRLLTAPVPVWTRADGTVLTPGDSKLEENEWNSTVLALAAAAMPTHVKAGAWTRRAVEFVMVGAAHPRDLADPTVVNGRPVRDWCAAGWNVQPDYTVINHGIVHPDYMQCVSLGLQSAVTYALLGKPAPIGLAWNAQRVYRALQVARYGGRTMYEVGNPRVYYPQGGDWGTRRPAGYACLDTMVDAMRLDADPWGGPSLPVPASYWEGLHIGDAAAMQLRPATATHPSGVLADTDTNTEDTYRSRVEWSAGHFGLAVLTRWVQDRFTWRDGAL
jgi:hypothetical protein